MPRVSTGRHLPFFALSALDPTSQLFAEHGEVEEVFVMRGGSRSGQCAVMYSED